MKTTLPLDFAPKRILVCQLRQLGDVILTTPALQLLHEHYPQAELHLFTEKKCVPLLENNPHVHKIWGLDKKALPTLLHEIVYYWRVARQDFDLVVDFQQLPRCRWVVGFSGAPMRLSYTPPWYTHALYNIHGPKEAGYAAKTKADVLRVLGITYNNERPQLYLTETEQHAARCLLHDLGLQSEHRLITLDPTHRRLTRRWPARHYASLMQILTEKYPQIRFMPLWGPGEEQDIQTLCQLFTECGGHKDRLLLPDRILSLREMAACIGVARLHIGNCSAPRHMAVALDVPSCTMLGATDSAWTYPSPKHHTVNADLVCQPCNKNDCSHRSCLEHLLPTTVAAYLEEHCGAEWTR